MNDPMLDTMTERLGRLERENRRLKRIGAVVLLGPATVLLLGQARPNRRIVEAELLA